MLEFINIEPFLIAGIFGSIGRGFKRLFGGSSDAENAAQLLAAQNAQSIQGIESQFGQTQAGLDPFIQAGRGGLERVEEGSTVGGFSDRLNRIFGTDIFRGLVDERTRAAQGQLSAGGLTRSGTALEEISNIPLTTGLGLENLLTSRSGALASQGLGATESLGRFGAQKEGALAGLRGATGQAQATGFLQDQAAGDRGFANLLGLGTSILGGGLGGLAGATAGGLGGVFGGGQTGGAISGAIKGLFFSDCNLKTNIKVIGEIGPLKLHKWDWKPETKGTLVENLSAMNTGFMSHEVTEFFPQHVYQIGGFDIIDYVGVHKDLKDQKWLL